MKKIFTYLFLFFAIFLAKPINCFAANSDKLLTVSVGIDGNSFTLKFSNTKSGVTKINVLNLIGRRTIEQAYNAEESIVFNDISSLANGIYIVLVKDANGKIIDTAKFMLNR